MSYFIHHMYGVAMSHCAWDHWLGYTHDMTCAVYALSWLTWCTSIIVEVVDEECLGVNNVEISRYSMLECWKHAN